MAIKELIDNNELTREVLRALFNPHQHENHISKVVENLYFLGDERTHLHTNIVAHCGLDSLLQAIKAVSPEATLLDSVLDIEQSAIELIKDQQMLERSKVLFRQRYLAAFKQKMNRYAGVEYGHTHLMLGALFRGGPGGAALFSQNTIDWLNQKKTSSLSVAEIKSYELASKIWQAAIGFVPVVGPIITLAGLSIELLSAVTQGRSDLCEYLSMGIAAGQTAKDVAVGSEVEVEAGDGSETNVGDAISKLTEIQGKIKEFLAKEGNKDKIDEAAEKLFQDFIIDMVEDQLEVDSSFHELDITTDITYTPSGTAAGSIRTVTMPDGQKMYLHQQEGSERLFYLSQHESILSTDLTQMYRQGLYIEKSQGKLQKIKLLNSDQAINAKIDKGLQKAGVIFSADTKTQFDTFIKNALKEFHDQNSETVSNKESAHIRKLMHAMKQHQSENIKVKGLLLYRGNHHRHFALRVEVKDEQGNFNPFALDLDYFRRTKSSDTSFEFTDIASWREGIKQAYQSGDIVDTHAARNAKKTEEVETEVEVETEEDTRSRRCRRTLENGCIPKSEFNEIIKKIKAMKTTIEAAVASEMACDVKAQKILKTLQSESALWQKIEESLEVRVIKTKTENDIVLHPKDEADDGDEPRWQGVYHIYVTIMKDDGTRYAIDPYIGGSDSCATKTEKEWIKHNWNGEEGVDYTLETVAPKEEIDNDELYEPAISVIDYMHDFPDPDTYPSHEYYFNNKKEK